MALSSDARREQSGCLTERNNPPTREILNCDFTVLRCAQREAFVLWGKCPPQPCCRWRQGQPSLEREHDYDTDRNEVYGFVGCRPELFQTGLIMVFGYRAGRAG